MNKSRVIKFIVFIVAIITSLVLFKTYGKAGAIVLIIGSVSGLFAPLFSLEMLKGVPEVPTGEGILVIVVIVGLLIILLSLIIPAILSVINLSLKKEGQAAIVLPVISLILVSLALSFELIINNFIIKEELLNSTATSILIRLLFIVLLGVNISIQKKENKQLKKGVKK